MMFSTPGVIQQTVLPSYTDTLPSGGVITAYTFSGIQYDDDNIITKWTATVNNSISVGNMLAENSNSTVAFVDGPSGYGRIPCVQTTASSVLAHRGVHGDWGANLPATFIVFYPETTDDNTKRRILSFNTNLGTKTSGLYGTLNTNMTYGCYKKEVAGNIWNDFTVTDVAPTQNNTGIEVLYAKSVWNAAASIDNRKLHVFSSDTYYNTSVANSGGDVSRDIGFFKGSATDPYEDRRDVMPMKVLEVILCSHVLSTAQAQSIYDYLYAKWGYLGVPHRTAT